MRAEFRQWLIATGTVVLFGVLMTAYRVAEKASAIAQQVETARLEESAPDMAEIPKAKTRQRTPSLLWASETPDEPQRGKIPRPTLPPAAATPSVIAANESQPESPRKLPITLVDSKDAASEKGAPPAAAPPTSKAYTLRREGTRLVDVKGTVRRSGDRFQFVPKDGSPPVLLLENQLLQRVATMYDRPIAPGVFPEWKITGLITEFRGSNFLLLHWAMIDNLQ